MGPAHALPPPHPAAAVPVGPGRAASWPAGPTAVVTLPYERKTIILAMDVSLSMGARDVDPNRITAAQTAAKAFVEQRPADVNIGIVAFGATAALVQPPTQNREELLAAIGRFQLQRGTATGSALYVALQTLFPDAGIDLESLVFRGGLSAERRARQIAGFAAKGEGKAFQPVAPGSYTSGVIVLLSDGRRTTGPDPLDAARMAADRGVRIFTVGFGTVKVASSASKAGRHTFASMRRHCKTVANVTRGEYFHAGTSEELKKVYKRLTTQLMLERKDTEIGFLFVALAAILLVASLACRCCGSGAVGRLGTRAVARHHAQVAEAKGVASGKAIVPSDRGPSDRLQCIAPTTPCRRAPR